MRRTYVCLLLASLSGCSLGLSYYQCDQDSDCASEFPDQPFCTGDHLCVQEPPASKLCDAALSYPAAPGDNAIPVGALLNLAQRAARTVDADRMEAIKMGVDEVNEQARFNRAIRPMVLHVCDTNFADSKPSADERKSTLEKMVTYLAGDKKVVGILGPSSSQSVLDVVSVAVAQQVPIISPSSSADYSTASNQGYIFRVCPTDSQQAKPTAKLLPNNTTDGKVRVSLVSVVSDYGEQVRKNFQSEWLNLNANNVPTFTPTYPDSLDAEAQVDNVAKALTTQDKDPTHVIIIIGEEVQPFSLKFLAAVKSLKTYMTATPTSAFLTDGGLASNLLELAKDTANAKLIDNLSGIRPLGRERDNTQKLRQPAAEFTANFPQDKKVDNVVVRRGIPVTPELGNFDLYITFAYDAFYTLAMAAQSVQATAGQPISGSQVANALRRFKSTKADKLFNIGPGSFASFNNGANALRSGGEVAMRGVTGTIRFTGEGDRDAPLFATWTITVPKAPMGSMTPADPPFFVFTQINQ